LIANLIAAPFNALLAARVEETLTGTRPHDADESLLKAIAPAVSGEIGKIVYFATRAVPLLLLLFVPGLNVLASAAWLLFGFWFLAIEYADYPMGNHGVRASEQRAHLRRKRFKSLMFGAGVTALMLIPVLQFVAMPAAVAGATRLWVDDLSDLA
nr:sulfate transporter CysZ [Gammaproteobacteria bacterium]